MRLRKRLAEEPLGGDRIPLRRQEEIDRLPSTVDRPIEIGPASLHPNVGLVHAPGAVAQALSDQFYKTFGLDISAASAVRTCWNQTLIAFFERYDFLVLPTAQVFPFAVETHWPAEIAGRQMETYHEWMKCVVPATMAGGPALAAPAGFGDNGLPMGIWRVM